MRNLVFPTIYRYMMMMPYGYSIHGRAMMFTGLERDVEYIEREGKVVTVGMKELDFPDMRRIVKDISVDAYLVCKEGASRKKYSGLMVIPDASDDAKTILGEDYVTSEGHPGFMYSQDTLEKISIYNHKSVEDNLYISFLDFYLWRRNPEFPERMLHLIKSAPVRRVK